MPLPAQTRPCFNPCAEPDLPNIGEGCAPEYGCEEGAFCDTTSDALYPTCRALPTDTMPCFETGFGDYLCAEGLFCDFNTDPDNPVCTAPPGLGEECPDFVCDAGLYCDSSAGPGSSSSPKNASAPRKSPMRARRIPTARTCRRRPTPRRGA